MPDDCYFCHLPITDVEYRMEQIGPGLRTVYHHRDVWRCQELMRLEDRPCIACSNICQGAMWQDSGGDQEKANFKFCRACESDTGHVQHPRVANRCRFCATQLRVARHIKCFEPHWHDHPLFDGKELT